VYNAGMAKKSSKHGDRHLHPKITLRLPPSAGQALRQMAEAEERTITAIVLRALRAYATVNGHSWPGQSSPPA
jgi:uncharacterized protein (DUF1778 family)